MMAKKMTRDEAIVLLMEMIQDGRITPGMSAKLYRPAKGRLCTQQEEIDHWKQRSGYTQRSYFNLVPVAVQKLKVNTAIAQAVDPSRRGSKKNEQD
jgi:hypothetical protein